jgi:lipoyl(octanoyl) transferase
MVEWRGRESFADTWEYQRQIHRATRSAPDALAERLIFVEHEPVVTLGRQGDMANLPGGETSLLEQGISLYRIERGGDITYHGPGQLVGYPIIQLRRRGLSLRDYLRGLEEVLIRTLQHYGLLAQRIPGLTGVWCEGYKLAAIGVAVQGGVSYHGFALNINPRLEHFSLIVPCGISDRPVGSIAGMLGDTACPDMASIRAVVEAEFRIMLNTKMV